MKKFDKIKIIRILQIVFMLLTFLGLVLLLMGKLKTAGMSICSMAISLFFGALYNSAKKGKNEK